MKGLRRTSRLPSALTARRWHYAVGNGSASLALNPGVGSRNISAFIAHFFPWIDADADL